MVGDSELTGKIVDTAYSLHSRLGPGLLESVYENIFARMLEKRGLSVERQSPVTFEFDGMWFEEAHRVDLLVEKQVIVELKATETLLPVHSRQIQTYLRLLGLPVGLLINFGADKFQNAVRRVLNPYALTPPAPPVADPDPSDGSQEQGRSFRFSVPP